MTKRTEDNLTIGLRLGRELKKLGDPAVDVIVDLHEAEQDALDDERASNNGTWHNSALDLMCNRRDALVEAMRALYRKLVPVPEWSRRFKKDGTEVACIYAWISGTLGQEVFFKAEKLASGWFALSIHSRDTGEVLAPDHPVCKNYRNLTLARRAIENARANLGPLVDFWMEA